ncbi:MAG: S53 family peptidase [Pseudomonas sp.]|nr:S53 family peptidase [Pseudomonas sp.]MBQ0776490.1 S53 family peptidase [Pseudomonas sp.]
MNGLTISVRRSACLAVLLLASGLHGCKISVNSDNDNDNADNETPAQENEGYVPAEDDFQHAYVLATDDAPVETSSFRQTMSLQSSASSVSSTPPGAWTPQQFQQAYNVPASLNGKPAGYGVKVAVITAYHYSSLQNDLNKFAAQYSLKPITLNIINQAGNITNTSWSLQSNLSVQMINAISPGATVFVIEAKTTNQSDMLTAITTAVNLGVNIILMPFGISEYASEGSRAYLFQNSQIVFVAAAGNNGVVNFPAASPDVVAVGGTTPNSGSPLVESAWGETGAGMSVYESMPSYQVSAVQKANTTAFRSVPDLVFNADPSYGARIYSSIAGGWLGFGGTSVSSTLFAGAVAIANQARRNVNKPMLSSSHTSPNSIHKFLYQLVSANAGSNTAAVLNDVVDGHAGGYSTGPGYDIATGLGSLDVEKFAQYMANQ